MCHVLECNKGRPVLMDGWRRCVTCVRMCGLLFNRREGKDVVCSKMDGTEKKKKLDPEINIIYVLSYMALLLK